MAKIDYNTAIQNAKKMLNKLPKEVLQARPDLVGFAQKVSKSVQEGNSDMLNEFIKENASHIK